LSSDEGVARGKVRGGVAGRKKSYQHKKKGKDL